MKPSYEVILIAGNDVTPNSSYIQRTDADGTIWSIPTDPANSDYQAYLTSLEAPTAQQGVALLIQLPLGVRFSLPRRG